MDFLSYISTDVGYTEDAPLTTTLYLTRGRLTGGFLFFPSGPAGTLHFLARMGLHQVLPFNQGENFRLDDCVIPFSLGIDLLEPPYNIDLITWNDSTTWPHALTVCFFLEPSGKKRLTLDAIKKALFNTNGYPKP